jgi:glycopeptide antibiotics resistance protein
MKYPESIGEPLILEFVPFRYLSFFNSYVIVLEIAWNILLTIPFGFGIDWIAKATLLPLIGRQRQQIL